MADLAGRFRFNTTLLGMLVEDFDGEDWSRGCAWLAPRPVPSPDSSADSSLGQRADGSSGKRSVTATWVLGHVAAMRLYLLRTVGVDAPERAWELRFAAPNPSPVDPSQESESDPIDVEDLLATIFSAEPLLIDALNSLSTADLGELWAAGPSADGSENVSLGDSVGFFYFDETYHLGQLGLLRQLLGKRPVV